MKLTLAVFSCLLALRPVFAQAAGQHPCQNRDQGWKAAFNQIQARFESLGLNPDDPRKARIIQSAVSTNCSEMKDADTFESCGAIVDHDAIKGLERKGSSWQSEGTTIMPSQADLIFRGICDLRDQREQARSGGGTQAQKEAANREAAIALQRKTEADMLRNAKRILDEADRSGIGAPSSALAAPPPPPAAPKAEPVSLVSVTFGDRCRDGSAAAQQECWCLLAQSKECQGKDTGACVVAVSMCPNLSQ